MCKLHHSQGAKSSPISLQVFSIFFNAEEKFLSVSQFWQLIHDKMRKSETSDKSLTL